MANPGLQLLGAGHEPATAFLLNAAVFFCRVRSLARTFGHCGCGCRDLSQFLECGELHLDTRMGGDERYGQRCFYWNHDGSLGLLFSGITRKLRANEVFSIGYRMGQIAINARRPPLDAGFPRGTTARATFSLMCARNSSRL
jgi:hypothetical protein